MTIHKPKGNMYKWITGIWNPIQGRCPHNCSYCYMQRFWNMNNSTCQVLKEKYLNDNFGENQTYFVCDSTDMFAWDVPKEWIERVLEHCCKYPKNTYLFQTKNPERFKAFKYSFPPKTILGTTIETNRDIDISKAPQPYLRYVHINTVGDNFRKMVSIEPIMDFDYGDLLLMMEVIKPEFVSIGADSKNSNLPEPSKENIENLIRELKKFTKVKLKDNLRRLMK